MAGGITNVEMSEQEAREIAIEIARQIDALMKGERHTAVIEARRHGARAPYLVFLVSTSLPVIEYIHTLGKTDTRFQVPPPPRR